MKMAVTRTLLLFGGTTPLVYAYRRYFSSLLTVSASPNSDT